MCNVMEFPKTIKEFIEEYQFTDEEQIYTNGSKLIQVFRIMQALEHYAPELYYQDINRTNDMG